MNTDQNSQTSQMTTDVDQLLSAFFKAEMPNPFPPLRVPADRGEFPMPVAAEAPRKPRERQPIAKSRLSLVVSAALLLGGCWYMSGLMGKAPERTAINKSGDSAHLPKALEKANQDLKKIKNMP